jgi:small GTP-binding protein
VGESGVGKSSLVSRFALDQYDGNFTATIGVDFKVTGAQVGSKKVKYQLWDTAGQERFAPIVTTYYRGAHAVVLVYDVAEPDTLTAALNKWLHQVSMYARPHAPVILVGNKCDLLQDVSRDGTGCVTPSMLQEALEDSPLGTRVFATTLASAKSGDNVADTFQKLAEHMLEQEDTVVSTRSVKDDVIDIRGDSVLADEKPSCCSLS